MIPMVRAMCVLVAGMALPSLIACQQAADQSASIAMEGPPEVDAGRRR